MKRERFSTDITRIQFDSMEEWLVNRKGIGGSDASAILGLNPYKTNQELWMEKKGQMSPVDILGKSYVKYGNDAEPLLRALFALDYPEYKVEYYDNNMIINKKYPWAHASLDGELMDPDGRRGILEIKTTNILQSMQWEKWDNRIPDNYYIQVLHYLLVTEYDFVVLKAQLKRVRDGKVRLTTKHYHIEREEVLSDIKMLKEEEEAFWHSLQSGQEPDPANIVTQQPAIPESYQEQAAKLRRKRVVIAITANETQFAYLNEVLMKLKRNAEQVDILESEEL